VRVTEELLGAGVDVYVNVDNRYEGSAPLTIRRIEAMMGEAQARP